MRSLYFSLILLLTSCGSAYRSLRPVQTDNSCLEKYMPAGLATSWYKASIDVVGKHISGLLLIKAMDNDAYRIVFTNEAGVRFFDFAFTTAGGFEVKHIIKQLNKRTVIHTLRKDFELLLGIPFQNRAVASWKLQHEYFFGWKEKKERAYFVTDTSCTALHRLERGSRRKPVVTITSKGEQSHPESILIKHHTFDMVINLAKLNRE